MHRRLRYARSLIGRRGAGLVLLGVVFLVYGLSMVTAPPPAIPGAAYLWHRELLPLPALGGLWMLSGLIALAWSPAKDKTVGFATLYVMPSILVSSYGWAWLVSLWTPYGIARGWATAIVWTAVVGLVALIAGWQEPVSRTTMRAFKSLYDKGAE